MPVDTSHKITPDQVYPLVSKVGRAINTCQDEGVECTISFLYEKNEVHSLIKTILKPDPLRSGTLTDVLKYLENCDEIEIEVKGESGFLKKIVQSAKGDTLNSTQTGTPSSTQPTANAFSGLGGLSGLLGGLGELSENKTGLGYIIAKSESASQIEAIRRDCDRQITEIEREAEKDRVYLNSQLQDRKYKIADLEREKRERDIEIKEWKEKHEQTKEAKDKLEQAKKDFDSTKLMSDIGKQLLGVTTLFFNRENGGEGAQMLNQGALGLMGNATNTAAEVTQAQVAQGVQSPYTPEKTNRIALLSSIGLFDRNDNDFAILYALLKMIKEHPESFNEIAKVMQKFGCLESRAQEETENPNDLDE